MPKASVSEEKCGKKIRIYDNGGKTADRFTVIYMDSPERGVNLYECLGMDERPFHPMGIGMHGSATPGRHLGRRIKFEDLQADCQQAVLRDLH
jgi:hypothetical protein